MLQLLIANQARVVALPPPQPPRLSLQKFQEGIDDIGAFLETFEATATAAEWPRAQWSLYLRSSLAGQGMTAVSMLGAEDQGQYEVVKQTLLFTYHISAETYRKKYLSTNLMWQNQISGFVHINKLLLSGSKPATSRYSTWSCKN